MVPVDKGCRKNDRLFDAARGIQISPKRPEKSVGQLVAKTVLRKRPRSKRM